MHYLTAITSLIGSRIENDVTLQVTLRPVYDVNPRRMYTGLVWFNKSIVFATILVSLYVHTFAGFNVGLI